MLRRRSILGLGCRFEDIHGSVIVDGIILDDLLKKRPDVIHLKE